MYLDIQHFAGSAYLTECIQRDIVYRSLGEVLSLECLGMM